MTTHRFAHSLIIASFAFRVCAAQNAAPVPMTVEDAVALVLSRNPALAESAHSIDASRARAAQSRSAYLPTAEIEATYVFLSPVSVFDLPGESINIFPSSNYDGHVGVRQTIYDFQRTGAQVRLADSRIALAEDSREAVKRDLGVRAADTFYAILFLRRSIEVQNEQVRTLGEHLAITHRRAEAGTATQLDELTTQVRVAAAQNVRIGLENSLRSAEISMRAMAALPSDAPLDLRGEFSPGTPPAPRDSLLGAAFSARIEARSAEDLVASARAGERAAGASDAPSLGASLTYGVKNGYIPNLDVLRGNVVAAVDFRVPIFDGNRTRSMEEEATAALHAAEARKQEVALMIRSEVDQALSDLTAAKERVGISQTNIQQADLAAANARLRYDAGSISNLDLLDAETAVAQARLTNLQALYDMVTGTIRLRRATGSPVAGN
jgi:outer membrane protein